MSLADALLLEPYRDPREVWLALRTDGQRGSGTVDDPYDASLLQGAALAIGQVELAGEPLGSQLQITTSEAHGFANGDRVTVAGVRRPTPPTADPGNAWRYSNGNFVIFSVTESTFRITPTARLPAAPNASSGTCFKCLARFDEIMRNVPSYGVVHLGPGVFPTLGYSPGVSGSWLAKEGQKIRGSGMEVTVVKLVNAVVPDILPHTAIGCDYWPRADYFEASDFTVDCNLPGQPVAAGEEWAHVACAAIGAMGSHTRLRRIHAVNWGSQVIGVECFVFFQGGVSRTAPEIVDCLIEDCILDQPSPNNIEVATVIQIGGGGTWGNYHRGCVVRNCVVDAQYRRDDVPIEKITFTTTPLRATLTTRVPHQRTLSAASGELWITVTGAVVGTNPVNPFNGSFKVLQVPDARTLVFDLFAAPNANPSGDMFLGRSPSFPVYIASIVRPGTGNEVELTTLLPHYRQPSNLIHIDGVTVRNSENKVVASGVLNGPFKVLAVSSPNKLTCLPSAQETYPIVNPGQIRIPYNGLGIGGGRSTLGEGNHVRNTDYAFYQDTHSTRHMTVSRNYCSNVWVGFYQNKTDPVDNWDFFRGSALAYQFAEGQHRAVFHSLLPHGLEPSDSGTMEGAVVLGSYSDNNPFNRAFTVGGVLNDQEFWYSLGSQPWPPPTDAGGSPVYRDAIMAVGPDYLVHADAVATFWVSVPASFSVGDWVSVFGARVGGSYNNPFNGVFRIVSIDAQRTSFTYLMASASAANPERPPPIPIKCAKQLGSPLLRSLQDGTLATYHSVRSHRFTKEDGIRIVDALNPDGTIANNPFNGYFSIESVPTPFASISSVSYRLAEEAASNAYGAPLMYELWQVGQMFIEDNVIELTPAAAGHALIGVNLAGAASDALPYTFKEFLCRGNTFYPYGEAVEGNYAPFAVRVSRVRRGLVENNVIDFPYPAQVAHTVSDTVRYFDNQSPDGQVLRGAELRGEHLETRIPQDDLADRIEDALLLSLL